MHYMPQITVKSVKITQINCLLAMTALALITACNPNTSEPGDRFGTQTPAIGDVVIAEVNGTLVTLMDVEREAALQRIIQPGDAVIAGSADYERIVNELIDQRLLALEAKKRKMDSDPDAITRLQIAREHILGNILVERVIADAVTDEAVRRLYDEQSKLVEPGEEIRARHILVENEEEAQSIHRALLAGGDFTTLAFERSKDAANRLEGGDLGYFAHDSMVAPFADAAFALEDGEISEPVQTRYGWHIIKVEARRQSEQPTFDEVRPRIVRFMTFDEIQKLVSSLRENAELVRKDDALKAQNEPDQTLAPASE